MQQVHHITPDQIPMLLAQNREQLAATNDVIDNKVKAVELLEEMGGHLEDGATGSIASVAKALYSFVAIQRIEYTQQLRALHAQQSQIQSLIHQLENPVSIPTFNPTGSLPPPPGSKPLGPTRR